MSAEKKRVTREQPILTRTPCERRLLESRTAPNWADKEGGFNYALPSEQPADENSHSLLVRLAAKYRLSRTKRIAGKSDHHAACCDASALAAWFIRRNIGAIVENKLIIYDVSDNNPFAKHCPKIKDHSRVLFEVKENGKFRLILDGKPARLDINPALLRLFATFANSYAKEYCVKNKAIALNY